MLFAKILLALTLISHLIMYNSIMLLLVVYNFYKYYLTPYFIKIKDHNTKLIPKILNFAFHYMILYLRVISEL